VVRHAADAIGDLSIRRAVSRPLRVLVLMAGRIRRTSLAADEPSKSSIFWQAGMMLTGTGTVGFVCDDACAISRWVAVDGISARRDVGVAPVTVPPRSA
jgi:hypothetical protein